MNGKLFLIAEPRHEFETRLPPGSLAASRRDFAFCVADPIGSAHESRHEFHEWTRIDTNREGEALRCFRRTCAALHELAPPAIRGHWCNSCLVSPHEGNSPVTISFTSEANPKGMLNISRCCKPPVIPGIK